MASTLSKFNEINQQPVKLREVYERYVIYWKWVLASTIVFLLLGLLFIRVKSDAFELKSSILVVDQSTSGGLNQMSLLKQLDMVGIGGAQSSPVNNENEIIKSTTLMKKVVDELELHTNYYATRFLKPYNLYRESPYHVKLDSLSLRTIYKPLKFSITRLDDGTYRIEGSYDREKFRENLKSLPALLKTPAGALSIATREGIVPKDRTIKVVIKNFNVVAREIAEFKLSTSVSKQIDVINMALKIDNVRMGQDLLEYLVYFYNQDAINQVNRSANNTKTFIDERLSLLTNELSTVERSVEDYKKANQLTDIETDIEIFLDRNDEFDRKRMESEMQLSLVRLVEDFMSNPANHNAMIPNLGLTDPGLIEVMKMYNELLMTRERVSGGTSADNPAQISLSRQVEATRNAIRTTIASNRKALELATRNLAKQNTTASRAISELPRKEREFIEIKRQQQVKETLYLFLLQKREEASLTMAVTLPKGTVLNSPDYADVTGMHPFIILFVFLIAGFSLPLLVVYLRNFVNTTITSRSQIELLTTVPILSELGHHSGTGSIIDHQSNTDSNTELFRLLRSKLKLVLDYPKQKVLLVTSTEPGEGKSFVSINLAISLSMTGKKVMLLGLDLRKPQLKKHLRLNDDSGMSAFLSGHEPDYRALIQRSEGYDNLDILAAGIIPPNPNELLLNQRLDKLFEELREVYDYVVIDTAPVGAVSDTFIIDRVVDLALYVVRMDYTDKRNIQFLNHVNFDKSLRRPYVVINDVNMETRFHSHRGYSYGYGNYYGKHKSENKK